VAESTAGVLTPVVTVGLLHSVNGPEATATGFVVVAVAAGVQDKQYWPN
jgi:hypothetical protein